MDHLRREAARKRAMGHVEYSAVRASQAPLPSASVEAREFREHLDVALGTLPEEFRTPFLLREQEGMSYEEIAQVLEISPKTVSTRIHRARTRLRGFLQPWLRRGGDGAGDDA